MLTVVLFVCLFFAGCHYLLYYPQWVLGAGRLSSLAVGGGAGGGWPFYGGEGHFQKHYWFWEVISRCESINWGVIFINFIKVVNKQ